jgi:outer membrane protein TolC
MTAAWQAASARYPQVTALDDPMLAATFGPETIHPDDRSVEFASRVEVSQKLPWPGKRQLRGESALAEAGAAANSIDDMRLQLIESAKNAFYDYYLAGRALAVNEETLDRLREFRSAAEALYRTPPKERKVSWQEVTQADVEIGRQQERLLTLERLRRVAIARLNTLMHRDPDLSLPLPPKDIGEPMPLLEPKSLRAEALARRPDLQALASHIAAEQASLDLAYKEFYPDFEPFFMYDRFMGNASANRDLATMLGVKLNLPLWQSRRRGAVAEAEARLAQRRAELDTLSDRIDLQIHEAYELVRESEQVLLKLRNEILPAAEQNLKAARADYPTGLAPAASVIEAERSRLMLYEHYYEAIADYHRRLATLERAIGAPLEHCGPTLESK